MTGLYGLPQLSCLSTGVWGDTVVNPCSCTWARARARAAAGPCLTLAPSASGSSSISRSGAVPGACRRRGRGLECEPRPRHSEHGRVQPGGRVLRYPDAPLPPRRMAVHRRRHGLPTYLPANAHARHRDASCLMRACVRVARGGWYSAHVPERARQPSQLPGVVRGVECGHRHRRWHVRRRLRGHADCQLLAHRRVELYRRMHTYARLRANGQRRGRGGLRRMDVRGGPGPGVQ